MASNYTLSISDPNNLLGSNSSVLVKDIDYVMSYFSQYIIFQSSLDIGIVVKPASENPNHTDGELPSIPAWVNYQGQETLAAIVKGQTGVDPNGAMPDAGFTIYAANDGTLKNLGSPLWFDPNPELGLLPTIPDGSADFISIATHELTHCFGFASWGAVNAPWNQHTIQRDGIWYYSSPAVQNLVGADLPLAPMVAGQAGDHIGNTSIAYQPIMSDLMYQFGNYANNRWQIGQLDLAILKDLGWATQNYQDLPLVDPLDKHDLVGTAGNDDIQVSTFSSTIAAGAGDDIIVLPSGTHNGNYFIDGGPGANTVVVPGQFARFNLVSYGSDFLLQSNDGSEGVSLLRSMQHIQFSDRTIVLTVAPAEITVLGNSVSIADNDTTPSICDFTDFGSATQGGTPVQHSFTVRNDGGSTLTISGLVLPPGFSLVEGLSSSIAPNGSDTFTVQLDTSTTGTKSGQISFATNDSDENPFNFLITGTVSTIRGNPPPPPGTTANMIMSNPINGAHEIYNVGSNAILAAYTLGQFPSPWTFAALGTFQARDNTDVLLRNTSTGEFQAYYVSDNNITNAVNVGAVGLDWNFAGTGNFDGASSLSELLLRNAGSGSFELYHVAGGGVLSGNAVAPIGNNFQVKGFGNFSGSPTTQMMMQDKTHDASAGQLELYTYNPSIGFFSGINVGVVGDNVNFIGCANLFGNGATQMVMQQDNGTFWLYTYDRSSNSLSGISVGAVGSNFQVVGFGPLGRASQDEMLMQDTAGNFEVYQYNASLNAFVGNPMGAVGAPWVVDGIAGNSPSGSGGQLGSTAQLVQAMAGFGGSSGAVDSLSTVPLGADTSQQSLLTTPHA